MLMEMKMVEMLVTLVIMQIFMSLETFMVTIGSIMMTLNIHTKLISLIFIDCLKLSKIMTKKIVVMKPETLPEKEM